MNKYAAYAIAWISTALVICAGIYFTHDMRCLWFIIVPSFLTVSGDIMEIDNNEKTSGEKDNQKEEG